MTNIATMRILVLTNHPQAIGWNEAIFDAINQYNIGDYTDSEILFGETDTAHEAVAEFEMGIEDRDDFLDNLLAFGEHCDALPFAKMEVTIPVTIDVRLEREEWGKIDKLTQGELIANFAVSYDDTLALG